MRRQAEQFGTEMTLICSKIEGESSPFEVHLDNGEIITTMSSIATGSSAKYLGIEGEEEAIGKRCWRLCGLVISSIKSVKSL